MIGATLFFYGSFRFQIFGFIIHKYSWKRKKQLKLKGFFLSLSFIIINLLGIYQNINTNLSMNDYMNPRFFWKFTIYNAAKKSGSKIGPFKQATIRKPYSCSADFTQFSNTLYCTFDSFQVQSFLFFYLLHCCLIILARRTNSETKSTFLNLIF